VLYDDWTVNCYDNRLQLLWSQVLFDVTHSEWRRYNVRAAGLLISPHNLASGDNGTIIVTASFVHSDHNIRFAVHHYSCIVLVTCSANIIPATYIG